MNLAAILSSNPQAFSIGAYEEITINMPSIENFGVDSVGLLKGFNPKFHNERTASRSAGLINAFLATKEFFRTYCGTRRRTSMHYAEHTFGEELAISSRLYHGM